MKTNPQLKVIGAYYHADEENKYHSSNIVMPKPWKTFTEDIKDIEQEILVAHYTSNPMGKQTKKKLRDSKGHIIRDDQKQALYAQGSTARGALHNDMIYGMITNSRDIDDKHPAGKQCAVKRIPLKEVDVKQVIDPIVKKVILDAIDKYGSLSAAIEAEQEDGDGSIWLNKKKGVKLKKVRCFQDFAINAKPIRSLRVRSQKEYKRSHYSLTNGNYMAAIYEGTDAKGKTKRTFEIISLFEAAQAYSKKAPLVPQTKDGFPLIKTIRLGDLVLLYENSPEEIYHASQEELVKRLYEIVGISDSGGLQIKMRHQQEAKPAGELEQINGAFSADAPIASFRMLRHTQFNAFVQGQDFNLSDTGKITFKSC